jgi:ribosome-binding factor A
MARYRQDRVNDAVKEEMAQILRDVKDPRIAGAFVSITAAEVTKDLKFAKIYYSVLGEGKDDVAKALKSAAGFFRSELARRINLRITPELFFEYDSSMEYGANISSILKTLDIKPDDEEEND